MTAMFLIVILGAPRRGAPVGFAPIAIGLMLTLIHLISIPITNTSVNPARSTAQAISWCDWALAQLWLFWLAPLVARPSVRSSTRRCSRTTIRDAEEYPGGDEGRRVSSITVQRLARATTSRAPSISSRVSSLKKGSTRRRKPSRPTRPAWFSKACAACFVATASGQSVGVATISLDFGIEFGWSAEMGDLYVLPEWRGHRVARAGSSAPSRTTCASAVLKATR